MKSLAVLAALAARMSAAYSGFNLAANHPDGPCKSEADWEKDFNFLKSISGPTHDFTSARLYATSDCNTLANAVPAALRTGTSILVGVWAQDSAHFNKEKLALSSVIEQHGTSWIIATSVGSEDLYRNTLPDQAQLDPHVLAQRIYDVRGMLRSKGVTSPVGHVDTWTAWVNGSNDAVITASDFLGMDAYPYFQRSDGNSIDNAYGLFYEALHANQAAAKGKPVWITETGWPAAGPTYGHAAANVANASAYWRNVGCTLWNAYDTFWYTLRDYTQTPSFGVVDVDFNLLYSLEC